MLCSGTIARNVEGSGRGGDKRWAVKKGGEGKKIGEEERSAGRQGGRMLSGKEGKRGQGIERNL